MERITIKIPKGIRYISEFRDYSLRNFNFPHILNKQITGCGFTEYCLTNDMDIILCSPRKVLLENKEEQHTKNVFYFRNEFEQIEADFDKDLNAPIRRLVEAAEDKIESEEELRITEQNMYDKIYRLKRELLAYIENQRGRGLPVKILVTYDSFKLVREFIEKDFKLLISSFQVVIDEFQSIFIDSRFKSNTEIGFLTNLEGLSKVCFVSATPMLDPYLDMLDEFKDLPYYEFDWGSEDPSRVITPNLIIKSCKSLISEAKSIIESYLGGDFEVFSYRDQLGRICEIQSKEAVLYFNSVKNICDLIRKCGLTPDNTNILCSRTAKNLKKIKKAFKDGCGRRDGRIGSVPKRGEPHKMFTFCTRTVYLGADFYSTCARSFIFSDANVDCLAVDISLDLPQILGRQRLDINPWKNNAVIFFKNLSSLRKKTRDIFNSILEKKSTETNILIGACNETREEYSRIVLLDRLEMIAKIRNYEKDYFSVNYDREGNPYPIFNKLVKIAEMRAFDIQQVDYKDRFSVFNAISSSGNSIEVEGLDQHLMMFDSCPFFQDKMRYVCTEVPNMPDSLAQNFLNRIPIDFRNFYTILGPERCNRFGYQRSKLKLEYDNQSSNQDIDVRAKVLELFAVGGRYSLSEVKVVLTSLFSELNYKASPKATFLNNYFDTRLVKITRKDQDGKSIALRGIEILSIKQ